MRTITRSAPGSAGGVAPGRDRTAARQVLFDSAGGQQDGGHARRRRPLPSALGPASAGPYDLPARAPADTPWLQPVPDRLVVDERADPAELVATRHSVRLALVAGVQLLPPRQRAAFVLCEVLALPAAETAELLEVSVAAVKSLLQRARATLAKASVRDHAR